jgi:phenylpyruvate tautomerase PptA (4-oxalocrotonate tautomerase family)
MPLYTVTTQAGVLDSPARADLAAALTLLIRTGRSAEYKREMLKRLWSLVQAATGAPDEEIVLGIQEVPSSQAMEMGQIMPDVASSRLALTRLGDGCLPCGAADSFLPSPSGESDRVCGATSLRRLMEVSDGQCCRPNS